MENKEKDFINNIQNLSNKMKDSFDALYNRHVKLVTEHEDLKIRYASIEIINSELKKEIEILKTQPNGDMSKENTIYIGFPNLGTRD